MTSVSVCQPPPEEVLPLTLAHMGPSFGGRTRSCAATTLRYPLFQLSRLWLSRSPAADGDCAFLSSFLHPGDMVSIIIVFSMNANFSSNSNSNSMSRRRSRSCSPLCGKGAGPGPRDVEEISRTLWISGTIGLENTRSWFHSSTAATYADDKVGQTDCLLWSITILAVFVVRFEGRGRAFIHFALGATADRA